MYNIYYDSLHKSQNDFCCFSRVIRLVTPCFKLLSVVTFIIIIIIIYWIRTVCGTQKQTMNT